MGFRVLAVAVLALVGLAAGVADPATADTAPEPPVTLSTVSADALPTVQINGVVWSQVIVGGTVYATGAFTQARPAGAAAGTNQTPRSNILAYTLATGALVTSFAPTLNAQGLAIAAAPDGSRIYIGGDFTSVNGTARNRIVALNPTTGAVITSFNATTNAQVRALAVTSTTVYAGGVFTTAGGVARSRLAAFSPATGAVTGWAPSANDAIWALVAPAGSGKVVAGGRFTTMNGSNQYGLAAVDSSSGATLAWPVNQIVRDAGKDASITSLTSDGTRIYGTGYVFGAGGNLENSFAADVATGNLAWVIGCLGDNYSGALQGGVFYNVGHPHNCSQVTGGFPESTPRTYQKAMAWSAAPSTLKNLSGPFSGRPAPELLHWLPALDNGSYTGQSQAAWSLAANSQYVVMGGEFPKVNNVAQQGLTRFAVRSVAPNTQGPQAGSPLTPVLSSPGAGRMKVSWTATWDRDNRKLTYQVLRGAGGTVLTTLTADSSWWNRPALTYTDTAAPAGAQTYRIRVRDALGNQITSSPATGTVP